MLTELLTVLTQPVSARAVAPVSQWDFLTGAAAIVVVIAAAMNWLDDLVHGIEVRYLCHSSPADYWTTVIRRR
jgi:hypothetical protein